MGTKRTRDRAAVRLLASPVLALVAAASAGAGERPPAVRGLVGRSAAVVRGEVLDQRAGRTGIWNGFRIDEVIWEKTSPSAIPAAGVRLFAHGPGVPEGAALEVGGTYVLAIDPLPPADDPDLGPYGRNLWEDFRPGAAGESPALVAPDGVVRVDRDPALAADVERMVRGLRDPAASPASRRSLLLELAGHREPAVREEAVRRLSLPENGLGRDPAGQAAAVDALAAEAGGPAHPEVLDAHLELVARVRPPGAGPVLADLLARTADPRIAARTAEVIARAGTAADLRDLAASFPAAGPTAQGRILRTLGLRGDAEHLTVLAAGLRSSDPNVRLAAVSALEVHPAAGAADVLARARRDPEPIVRLAAVVALDRRARVTAAVPGAAPPPVNPGRMRQILDAARRRAAAMPAPPADPAPPAPPPVPAPDPAGG